MHPRNFVFQRIRKGRTRRRWIILAVAFFVFIGIGVTTIFIVERTPLGHPEGTKEVNRTPIHVEDGFADRRKVINGKLDKSSQISYIASVERGGVYIGNYKERLPHGDCKALMAVRFKYSFSSAESAALEGELKLLKDQKGVIDEYEVYSHVVIIQKFCGPREGSPGAEQWAWEEIWKKVQPLMDQYLNQQAQRN